LIAWNLAQGNGYRMFPDSNFTMLRTPGYVLPLAFIFIFSGKSLVAAQIMNLIFSCLTILLIQMLAQKVGLSKTAGILASLLYFFHPGIVIAESRVGPEIMLTFCLVATVLGAIVAGERQTHLSYVLTGIVNGWAVLVKPSVIPVLPVWFLYRLWKERCAVARKKIWTGLIISGLLTVATILPWTVRNYNISGKFIFTSTLSGLVIYQGVHIIKHLNSDLEPYQLLSQAADEQFAIANAMSLKMHARQEYGALDLTRDPGRPFFPQFFRVEDEVLFYRTLERLAINDYLRRPELVLQAIAYNSWAFWTAGKTRKSTILNALLALPLLVLSGMGLWRGMKKGWPVFQLFLVVAVFMIPHLLILGWARFYLPIEPFLAILVAIPLIRWHEGISKGTTPAVEMR
jgi:4-amino-4-deoxy-L-arabinose transferase-like glycosyltransferase